MERAPVLMLGLDAADADVVERLMAQGRLPNLQRLRLGGVSGRLSSPAGQYAGAVWPTFYTGMDVPWHGVFHNKLWRPDAMRVEVAGEHWIDSRPIWESLGDEDLQLCLVDVPMVLGPPKPLNGVHLSGWGTHDVLSKGAWPPELWQQLVERHGAPIMPPEHFGAQSARSLQQLSVELERATSQLRDIAIDLLQREPWQLACVVFGATHRAGHYLWDRSQVNGNGASAPDTGDADAALADVYQHVDAAIGAILRSLDRETLVIAFAVHGMGANPGWSDLLPELLAQLETARSGEAPKRGLLYALKQKLPFHWVRPVLRRLPLAITDRLVSIWSARMFDWSQTRYFPMPMDEAGYLRINLRGREPDGIVNPGDEYDTLSASLERLMLSLRDAETGAPLASAVHHAYRDADPRAPYRELLPDLIVPWNGPPASSTRHVVSSELPEFRYRVPQRLPSGRSGNHTDGAWFIANGPEVGLGRITTRHAVIDLLPTVLQHLEIAPLPGHGTPIDLRGPGSAP
jgi:predicted AlkP superfamily phosphohydrolase/phosphomutase